MTYSRITPQTLLGGIVVLAGLALLGQTTGAYDATGVLRFVPSLFVLVGLYALVASDFRNVVGPLLVVAVASAWQLVALGVATWGDVRQFWPVLVVAFGLSLLLGRVRTAPATLDGARVDVTSVFGGRDVRPTSKAFVGGTVTALFGAAEVDLRDAEVAAPPAHLNVTALFGGAEIVVPREWNVRLDVLPVFGAAEDERPRREAEHEAVDLVVEGFCAFGGVGVTD